MLGVAGRGRLVVLVEGAQRDRVADSGPDYVRGALLEAADRRSAEGVVADLVALGELVGVLAVTVVVELVRKRDRVGSEVDHRGNRFEGLLRGTGRLGLVDADQAVGLAGRCVREPVRRVRRVLRSECEPDVVVVDLDHEVLAGVVQTTQVRAPIGVVAHLLVGEHAVTDDLDRVVCVGVDDVGVERVVGANHIAAVRLEIQLGEDLIGDQFPGAEVRTRIVVEVVVDE